MAQLGANQPQDVQESHDHTTTTNNNSTPVGSTDTANSNSSSNSIKSSEKNAMSKQAKPAAVVGVDAAGIGGNGNDAVVVDGVQVGGEGGGDDRGRRRSKSRSSSDGGDHEITDAVAGAGGGGSGGRNDKRKSAADVEHEMHIWTERERRKKMKNMFSSLHALLPQLPDKTDKARIVGEAIHYIKTLQDTLQKLEKVKLERRREQKRVCEVPAPAAPPRPEPAATREAALADMTHGWNTQQAASADGAPRSSAAAPAGAVTAPPPFQTWSGPNIVLSTAGDEAFITLSTPRQRCVFTTVLSVLEKHQIDVVTATVSSDQNRNLFSLHVRINGASGQVSGSLAPEDKYKLAVSEMMIWLSN